MIRKTTPGHLPTTRHILRYWQNPFLSYGWITLHNIYIYTHTPHFFFHSSTDGHLGCLHKHFSVYKMLSNMLSQLIFTKAGITSISILQMRIQSQAVKRASLKSKPRFCTYIYNLHVGTPLSLIVVTRKIVLRSLQGEGSLEKKQEKRKKEKKFYMGKKIGFSGRGERRVHS